MKPMTRRSFIRQAGLAAAATFVGTGPLRAAGAPKSDRPNILIVLNDDQSWLECSAYGDFALPTPHFDRIAREGILFNHGYCSAPSCAPSRASLLTGRNFWELEQGAFIQAWLPSKFAVLPDLLEAGGYHAGFTAKGWGPGVMEHSGRTRNPAGRPYSSIKRKPPEDGINPIDYAANFAQFLDQRPKGKPFYFWAGLTEPHGPWGRDNFKKLGVPLDKIKVPGFLPDTPGVRRGRANYLYEVRHADATLGALLKILEDRGELQNTLVIVTGDNGTPCQRSKATVYDWGLHVPLAMMWPARIKPGRKVDDFVNFIDIAPTILEAAGLPVPREMTGRSAMKTLLAPSGGLVDPARTWTAGGLEWHGELKPYNLAGRMIRDGRYQYIVNYSAEPRFALPPGRCLPDSQYEATAKRADVTALLLSHPEHPAVKRYVQLIQAPRPHEELYDCQADPWELTNLAGSPQHAEVKTRLKKQLEDYQRKTGDPRITGDMTLFGQTRDFVQDRKKKGYGRD